MEKIIFLSKAGVFSGDYSSDLHNRGNEPAGCLHYHDFYEFFVQLGASGAFVLGPEIYPVRQGDIIPVSMFTPHMLIPDASGDCECFVAHINAELLISFSTGGGSLLDIFRQTGQNPVIHLNEARFARYRDLLQEYQDAHARRSGEVLCKAIIHLLLALAYQDCAPHAAHSSTDAQHLAVVTRLINYINVHLAEPITLQQLADQVNYNTYYVCHLFKAYTGRSLTQYILDKRVEHAASLLRHSASVGKAAELSGFFNHSHFYKAFRQHMGCSPSAYQKAGGP